MTPETPKPCPFCGNPPAITKKSPVMYWCDNNHCPCSDDFTLSDWNHRPAESALAIELAEARKELAKAGPRTVSGPSRDELVKVVEGFVKWFDGWCPQNKCCADSGLPIHEAAIKLLKGR